MVREMPERVRFIPKECPHRLECRDGGCIQVYRIRQYICTRPYDEDSIQWKMESIRRFNKGLKTIPAENRYRLKGVRCWRSHDTRVVVDDWADGFSWKRCLREAKRLIKAGFLLEFLEEGGMGSIKPNEDGTFTVELWVYRTEHYPLEKVSLEAALEWVLRFAGYEQLEAELAQIEEEQRIKAEKKWRAKTKTRVVPRAEIIRRVRSVQHRA